ncbi:MAG: hypothetical protein IKZ82_13920 [Clostridia bacterium]|nr:hypothetical protein [Clostridia bacterium]
MDNSKLTVTVRNKVPEIRYGDYLVSDNKQLKIVFDLDSEWDAYPHKTARFDFDGWQFDIAFTGDSVTLPLLPAYTGELKAGLYAGDLATTTAVSIPVRNSILASGGAVSLEDAAEMARVSAEADRVDAENARAAAELLRQQAEFSRQFNENLRIEAETARASAERARSENEADRHSAESVRAAAESARAGAEGARAAAEIERGHNENARELAEYRRSLAEQARQSAEVARAGAESARASAETARATAEVQRSGAERTRASSETERVYSESQRAAAENLRASAENARASAENTRTSQESARACAELTREQNEARRIQNELAREQRIAAVIAEFSDYMDDNDVFNVLALIREYGMRAAFRMFCNANAPIAGLDTAVRRFFSSSGVCTSETYTSIFYTYSTSPSPVGTKKDDNANLVCVPSTNSTAGRDDYANLPLFACFDCNYTIDATTLEPVIHAIKGVYGDYSSAPANSFVGVLQMTGWVRRTADDTSKTVEYAAYKKGSGFKPLPEAVRALDNSVRPYVIHAKYAAGCDSLGMLSSVSGVMPASGRPASAGGSGINHDAQIALWRIRGDQYAGSSICDQAFVQTMLEIKYANLGSVNIMKGCRNYNYSFTAAVSETGVKRILLTAEQTSELVVGSSISLGTSSDCAENACYSICPISRIVSITQTVVNGSSYMAVNIDSDTSFDTFAGSTQLTTHPWFTGSTDRVKGNDGSPFDNLSGKEPCMIQGIELMLGLAEAAADIVTAALVSGYHRTSVTRTAGNIRSKNNSVDQELLGNIYKGNCNAGNQFIKELNSADNDPETYMLAQSFGASSSTGYCAANYVPKGSTTTPTYTRAWNMYGNYTSETNAGFAYCDVTSLTDTPTARLGCRACGTAGSRGTYTESTGTLG